MKRELLFSIKKDSFELQPFKGSGKGGQHRNKVETAMRIVHKPSGAFAESQEFKSQAQNKKAAFKRLTETKKFKIWLKLKVSEMTQGKTIEQTVQEMMHENNLKIEVRNNNKWVEQ